MVRSTHDLDDRLQDIRDYLPSDLPDLLRVREVAEILRVSDMTIYRLIQAGGLRTVRVRRSYRIHKDDLAAYLTANNGAVARL